MDESRDFFISYTAADKPWAEWVAWTLEAAGYTTTIQAWDFNAGGNFVANVHQALKDTGRTLLILSPDALKADFVQEEWTAALKQNRLVPVRVREVEPEGLLGPRSYIDLVGLDEVRARARLITSLKPGRAKTPPGREAPRAPRTTLDPPHPLTNTATNRPSPPCA